MKCNSKKYCIFVKRFAGKWRFSIKDSGLVDLGPGQCARFDKRIISYYIFTIFLLMSGHNERMRNE